MGRLRLALVVPALAESGGVSTVADFIYETIIRSGEFDVDLISLATSSSDISSVRMIKPRSWFSGVQVHDGIWKDRVFRHVGSVGTEFEFARYLPRKKLTQLLNKYDAIQVVAGTPAWAMVCRDVKRPVFLQVATLARVERASLLETGNGPVHLWRKLMTRITSIIDQRALKHVDCVFVENQWMNDFVSDYIGRNNVIYAPPGVDTSLFHPRNSANHPVEPYILSVGRFADPRKNVPLLFESYAELRGRIENAPKLIMAGKTEPTASDWNLAGNLGILDWIDFRQGLEIEQLTELYRNAQMFVLASDEEGFGMVIVEAMASGIPVVSTRSGGPDGIIDDEVTGLLVPLQDPQSLATAMVQLVRSDNVRVRMGKAARQTAEDRFSLNETGKAFLRAYKTLLDQRANW